MGIGLGTTASRPAGVMGSQQHPIHGSCVHPKSHPKTCIPSLEGDGDAPEKSSWMSHINPTRCSLKIQLDAPYKFNSMLHRNPAGCSLKIQLRFGYRGVTQSLQG